MFRRQTAPRTLITLLCLVGMVVLATAEWSGGKTAYAAGVISGTVYQDFNGSGTREVQPRIPNAGSGDVALADDRGVGGVRITAYDRTGAEVGTALSGPDGNYSLTTDPSSTGPYRVEFTGIQNILPGFQPGPAGTNNGTTIQFVPEGGRTGVDLGIIVPDEYCQNNPSLVTSCFKRGAFSAMAASEPTVLDFSYDSGSEFSGTQLAQYKAIGRRRLSVPARTVGALWGLDYARTRDEIYGAAFFKKHISFGPGRDQIQNNVDDAAAVYVKDETTGNVKRIFTVPGITFNNHNYDNRFAPDGFITDGFNVGWDSVGKTSLGGIALSDDETVFYVMNLENRTLYALNALDGSVIGSQAVPGVANPATAPPLPAPSTRPRCDVGDIRPFAVHYYRGLLYVGITCTAESSTTVDRFTDNNGNERFDHNNATERASVVDRDGNEIYNRGDVRELRAYVYTVNPTTLAFSAEPVFQLPLDYSRGLANANGVPPAEWRPWVDGFDLITIGERTVYYPQPWLTDLSFDGGDLLLMFRDRTGDTTGFQAPTNPAEALNVLYNGVGVGDVLRACGSLQAGWTLESNGRCGNPPRGTGPQDDGQGPDEGEFFFQDGYGIRGQLVNHDEVSMGGSVQVPGHPDVIVSAFDAFPRYTSAADFAVFNGGFRWYNNVTGDFDKSFVVFDVPSGADPLAMGKANGLGDLIVLCDEAPIEIGNLVWRDDNLNGRQDPGEPPIEGVRVELYEAGNPTSIAFAITDRNGNYIFSAYADGRPNDNQALSYGLPLKPNTSYEVRIPNVTGPNQQPTLAGLLPTLPLTGGETRDSNGVQSGTIVLTTLTTGGVGANNHTYDFGFASAPTSVSLGAFTAERTGGAVAVRWRTTSEVEVWGFNLYRSASGQRADAVQANEALLVAKGRGSSGAAYTFIDAAAAPGVQNYWLEVVGLDGRRTEYGPISTERLTSGQHRAWLPLVVK